MLKSLKCIYQILLFEGSMHYVIASFEGSMYCVIASFVGIMHCVRASFEGSMHCVIASFVDVASLLLRHNHQQIFDINGEVVHTY